MSDVLGVLINWKRPANVLRVLQAMREQSVRFSKIVLVECSPSSEFTVSTQTAAMADCLITISENTGPIARLVPPLMFPQYKYTYFGVDDHIPGSRHLEWLLSTATSLKGNFATIGQDGRRVVDHKLLRSRIGMDPLVSVGADVITTSELMQTCHVPHVMDWRARFLNGVGKDCSFLEDDLFICFGAQDRTGYPSYLTPEPPTSAESWRSVRLPAPHALCGREDHHAMRDYFVSRAEEFGWRSLV